MEPSPRSMARQSSSTADQYRAAAHGENVITVFPPPDVAAHVLTERVVVETGVTDGQQVAVLGIEDEEQAVEQNQGGLAHIR